MLSATNAIILIHTYSLQISSVRDAFPHHMQKSCIPASSRKYRLSTTQSVELHCDSKMPLLRLYERSDSAAAPTPILALDEQIIQFQDGIRMVLGNDDLGAGSLYVTNRNVVWLSSDDERLGWSIDLPFVTLHAISTSGNEDFPGPWLLLQFDVDLDCEPDAISECRFVPLQESLALNSLYLSMCSAMQQTSSNAEHPEVKIGNDIGEHDMDEVDQEGQ